MTKLTDNVIDYYHTKESRWGYKLVLGGTKHFGYYPEEHTNISMRQAMINMMDKVGESLDLPTGNLILDAGCGEGATAQRLAEKFGFRVEGVDLLDFNIAKAKRRATNSKGKLKFSVGDYSNLKYPDNYFDGIYTLETLVHSPDYKKTLQEFRRLLKKNGKLVLFEYSMPKESYMSKRESWAFKTISEGSAMHSYPHFRHGALSKYLKDAGFKNIKTTDITVNMVPMLKRFHTMGIAPYQIIKILGKERKFVNTTSGVELYRYRDKFRYNIIIANKS